jgi:2-amino-4-hydroxy-6-hydroxymethyldihydropteridine diphosphokinase
MRAGIALGSNLGDRLMNLSAARHQIAELPDAESPMLASAAYETEPVNCEPGAPTFLNAVIEIGYRGAPAELLAQLRGIETKLGRPAAHRRNVSRLVDLDLLYFGDLQSSSPDLQVPHPRIAARRFVLEPLAEIRPDLVLVGQTRTVAELLDSLPDREPLVRSASEW